MTPRLRSTSAILVAFAVPLCVYVASLRGDLSFWDTADLQTVPYILGIPYPTGFPGFVLLGWAWSHLEPIGSVAVRMNALTAVASAVTVAAIVAALLELDAAIAVALGAGALFAFASLPWNHATYVDVHPVSFAAVAVGLVFALRWQRDGRLSDAAGTLGAAVGALALDNTTVLMLPGLALIALMRRPPLAWTLRAGAIGLAALALVYAYLPVRSALVTAWALDPTLALGVPPGRPFWDDGHPASWNGFVHVVSGAAFGPQRAALSMLAPQAFRRIVTEFGTLAEHELGLPLLILALFGGILWWWRAPFVFGGLLLFAAVPLLFIFSYPAESDTTRYFLAGYVVLVLCAGYGADALRALPVAPRIAAGLAGAVVVFGSVFTDVQANVALFTQPTDPGASLWIERVKLLTRDNAIIVAPWIYATPLGYGAYVEHALGRRIVVTADAHEYAAKYRAWLARRPLVVVSDNDERFPGFHARQLDPGSPHVYALR
jgi:hypothetical protein